MKIALIVAGMAGAVIAGYYFRIDRKLLSYLAKAQKKTETVANPLSSQDPEPTVSLNTGKVAGISTSTLQGVGQAVLQTGNSVGKTVSGILLSNAQNSGEQIQVAQLTAQISKQIESIPSQFVQQAKIAYCQQVLIEATKSATSH